MKKIRCLAILLLFAFCISGCMPKLSASSSNSSNEHTSADDAEYYCKYYAYMLQNTEIDSPNDIMNNKKFIYILLCSAYEYFHREGLLDEQRDEFNYIHAKLTWDQIAWTANNLFGIEKLTPEFYKANAIDGYENAYQDGYIDYIPIEKFDFESSSCEIKSMNVSDNIYTFEVEIHVVWQLGDSLTNLGIYLYELEKLNNNAFKLISVKAG